MSAGVPEPLIDDEAWLAWGRENLTAEEYERRERAVEIDRLANFVTTENE